MPSKRYCQPLRSNSPRSMRVRIGGNCSRCHRAVCNRFMRNCPSFKNFFCTMTRKVNFAMPFWINIYLEETDQSLAPDECKTKRADVLFPVHVQSMRFHE